MLCLNFNIGIRDFLSATWMKLEINNSLTFPSNREQHFQWLQVGFYHRFCFSTSKLLASFSWSVVENLFMTQFLIFVKAEKRNCSSTWSSLSYSVKPCGTFIYRAWKWVQAFSNGRRQSICQHLVFSQTLL